MFTIVPAVRRFLRDEDAASLLEYGILILLIALLSILAVQAIGSKVRGGFTAANSALP
jgi:Flp pilus assembly pilin Flp